jgi:hypothetical protein
VDKLAYTGLAVLETGEGLGWPTPSAALSRLRACGKWLKEKLLKGFELIFERGF